MIEFHDVHKSFGSLEVLKGINLKIEKSQVVTLIGPSGSGKSNPAVHEPAGAADQRPGAH